MHNFSNINKILNNSHATVSSLLEEENIVEAVKQGTQICNQFLSNHINEVLDIILKDSEKQPTQIVKNALNVIASRLSLSSREVLKAVLHRLYTFITDNTLTPHQIINAACQNITTNINFDKYVKDPVFNFSFILHYLIQTTNSCCLSEIEESKCLIPQLIKNINHASILNLLEILTQTSGQHMDAFLANSCAISYFMSEALKNTDLRKILLPYVKSILQSYYYNAKHFKFFESENNLRQLFDIAFSSDIRSSSIAFQIICKIIESFFEYEEEERKALILYNKVIPVVLEMIPHMVDFVVSTDSFLMNKNSCISVLLQMEKTNETNMTVALMQIALFLFELMGRNELHTILHDAFSNVLKFFQMQKNVNGLVELFQTIHMKRHILEVYSRAFHPNKLFYYQFAEVIVNSENKGVKIDDTEECNELWREFVSTAFAEAKSALSDTSYGGDIRTSSSSFDSFYDAADDIDLDDAEDDRNATLDPSGREAAIQIFGADVYNGIRQENDEEEDEYTDDEEEEVRVVRQSASQMLVNIEFEEEEDEEQ